MHDHFEVNGLKAATKYILRTGKIMYPANSWFSIVDRNCGIGKSAKEIVM